MKLGFIQLLESMLNKMALPEKGAEQAVVPDIVVLIEQAKQEWKQAANYFNNVSDPELVDHAILLREAAERRYMYLLKQAKLAELQAFALDGVTGQQPSVQVNEPA